MSAVRVTSIRKKLWLPSAVGPCCCVCGETADCKTHPSQPEAALGAHEGQPFQRLVFLWHTRDGGRHRTARAAQAAGRAAQVAATAAAGGTRETAGAVAGADTLREGSPEAVHTRWAAGEARDAIAAACVVCWGPLPHLLR